jgi:acetolactate synthase-1/2/3 large subunit
MKGSDFIVQHLESIGVKLTFVLTGGCIVHFIDSLAQSPKSDYLPLLHEQSCSMAADAYARVTGNLGVVATTSGPGATNLLTGVCCSFYDSIPVLLITGQVHSSKLKGNLGTRQYGFQETDVVSIFSSVTKYSAQVNNRRNLRYELEKAIWHATNGRKGPVLLDIVEDVLYGQVDHDMLGFNPEIFSRKNFCRNSLNYLFSSLCDSSKPVLVLGAGALSICRSKLKKFIDKLSIPVLLTWGAFDLIDTASSFFVGGFGVTSPRGGNFTIQNADFILAIGTRFDTHEIGSDVSKFSPHSKRFVVDIDSGEIAKYSEIGFRLDEGFIADGGNFVDGFMEAFTDFNGFSSEKRSKWLDLILKWNSDYPVCHEGHKSQSDLINPYVFFECLGSHLSDNSIIVADCGSNLIWTMQSLQQRSYKHLFSAFNHSPMGYSLPAAIGAYMAKGHDDQVICIIGDGGFQLNIQELAVIARHNLEIIIFVLNNHSHGIIQGTQDSWLNGRHHASSPLTGKLPDPSVVNISKAYGLHSVEIETYQELERSISSLLKLKASAVVNINMQTGCQIEPKLLYGRSLEDSHPLLDRSEIASHVPWKVM